MTDGTKYKEVADPAQMSPSVRARSEQAAKGIGKGLVDLLQKAERYLASPNSRKVKYLHLRALCDEAMKLVAPYTPCKKGCSYCCWIAVPISEEEANILSEYTGRKMADVKVLPTNVDPEGAIDRMTHNAEVKYKNKVCPFNGPDGDCTVYPVRPMPCRSFHVIEDNAEKCDCFSGSVGLNLIDVGGYEGAAVDLFSHQRLADIRDWFPGPNND